MARTPCIAYRGSKQAIAPEIIRAIKALCPNAIYFYDLFGGGGAITVAALQSNYFKKVFYNEYDKGLVNLLTFLRDLKGQGLPKEYWAWVSREKFESLRDSDDDSAYATMVRRIWSFGNNGTGYMFGKNLEHGKQLIHKWVVDGDINAKNELQEYLKGNFTELTGDTIHDRYMAYRANINSTTKAWNRAESWERLQTLERLQALESLQALEYQDVKIETPIEQTVIYCDPPYRNTAGYNCDFDVERFDKWFRECPYTCFLSEYDAPFTQVGQIKKQALNASGKTRQIKSKMEKLYWNK